MRRYEDAVQCLNSRRARAKPNLNDMRGSDDMSKWLGLLGYSVEDLNRLNVIHIAGTKGKGSTCAFVASFLTVHGKGCGWPRKIGLYTSPHMTTIRERIRINGDPISEQLFTTRFYEVWDKLPSQPTSELDIPRYLQLLALLSFHVFIKESVEVAVYETHLGGEYDATNIITAPTVTAITPISMDHCELLGPSIENIAWHKAGILKPGSPALSTHQEHAVVEVLKERAHEKGVVIEFVGTDSMLPTNTVALKPKAQKVNCSLALAIVRTWLSAKAPKEQNSIDSDILDGVEQFFWPGRYQEIRDRHHQWFLDGAHNESSLRYTGEWFSERIMDDGKAIPHILIFSHFSKRDGVALLRSLAETLRDRKIQVHTVILSSYDVLRDGVVGIDRNLTNRFSHAIQEKYAEFWRQFDPTTLISAERTIEEALDRARRIGDEQGGMQVLITGSLHLASGALFVLESTSALSSYPSSRSS